MVGYAASLMNGWDIAPLPSGHAQKPLASLSLSSGIAPPVSFSQDLGLPNLLSTKDTGLYKAIFIAQKHRQWKDADALITQLKNPLLIGHILAMRYLDRRYEASLPELNQWLETYADHPQACAIYDIAALKGRPAPISKSPVLQGYGDDNGMAARMEETPYARDWHAGLTAWQNGHVSQAAHLFSTMAQKDDMPPAAKAAAAYWAYRAYKQSADRSQAILYLRIAASQPRSFYGILARGQLKQSLELDTAPLRLSDSDVLEMIGEPAIRRILALAMLDESELAEREIRAQFPKADPVEKFRLLALAHELNLASVQIGMAKQLYNNEQSLDYARYPIPDWEPEGGFTVDPALIFALMRQESGFHASAVSPGGALGLMQLMPQTASMMHRRINGAHDTSVASLTEPVMNMTLGQNYVRHLLDNSMVQGNLVYMLTAYNAGPGRLQDWKQSTGRTDDPLLFIETIPYSQTRYYVMQVMANYWIYSEIAGKQSPTVYALLKDRWPAYDNYIAPVASRAPDESETHLN